MSCSSFTSSDVLGTSRQSVLSRSFGSLTSSPLFHRTLALIHQVPEFLWQPLHFCLPSCSLVRGRPWCTLTSGPRLYRGSGDRRRKRTLVSLGRGGCRTDGKKQRSRGSSKLCQGTLPATAPQLSANSGCTAGPSTRPHAVWGGRYSGLCSYIRDDCGPRQMDLCP